jgi:hypothetical protein
MAAGYVTITLQSIFKSCNHEFTTSPEQSFKSLITTNYEKNLVRFHVLTAGSMKVAVFWVDAPCGLVSEVLAHRPDDGGTKHL